MIQSRYRRVGLAAVAIFFGLVGSAATAGAAGPPPRDDDPGRSADAPGQVKKADEPAPATDPAADTGGDDGDGSGAAATENTDTGGGGDAGDTLGAAAAPASAAGSSSTSASGSGFTGGGQVCDGDPSGRSSTGNGANTNGPGNDYAHNCGADSANGNGGGKATGRPCAGCVGNADDKNPPGQFKNGNDKNHGYECDVKGKPNGGNNGVGKGNPAHTPCKPTTDCTTNCNPCTTNCNPCTTDCNPCTTNCNPCTTNCNPCTTNCTTTTANCTSNCTSTEVLSASSGRPTEVLGVQVTRGAGLAFTGAATTPLTATAIALVCMGAALAFIARRREEELVQCAARIAGHFWVSPA